MRFKMLQNANQFGGKPQSLSRILLIRDVKRLEISIRHLLRICRQAAIDMRNNPVMFHQSEKALPIAFLRKKRLNSIVLWYRTAGE